MTNFKIAPASLQDIEALAIIFIDHISAHTEYISHGEIQMGVGEIFVRNGHLSARPTSNARKKWMQYILAHLNNKSMSIVLKATANNGDIEGFCITDIEEDGDAPFGVICDVLVKESCRGYGVGDALIQTAISWLNSKNIKDIFLESGKDNHAAHEFFTKRGFYPVSQVFKFVNNDK